MLSIGKSRITILRPGGNVKDDNGGWVEAPPVQHSERGTLRSPSHAEIEQAATDGVRVDYVVDVRHGADVRRGDNIEVSGNPHTYTVESVPKEHLQGRRSMPVFVRRYEKGQN